MSFKPGDRVKVINCKVKKEIGWKGTVISTILDSIFVDISENTTLYETVMYSEHELIKILTRLDRALK